MLISHYKAATGTTRITFWQSILRLLVSGLTVQSISPTLFKRPNTEHWDPIQNMAIRKPSTAQPPLPSETSPLLNDQLHDGFGAENGQSQRDEGEQPQEGVKRSEEHTSELQSHS